jgi:integrase
LKGVVMPVMNFTQAFMATGLIVPPGKQKIEYSVADEPGLFVECRASAKAIPTWYLRLKNAKGTNEYVRLGVVKEVSLTQARRRARELKAERAKALQSMPTGQQVYAELTLETFVQEHYLPYAKVHKRSWKRDEQAYRMRVRERFGNVRLCDITRYQVQRFQTDLASMGIAPATQDHDIKLLRRALNLAVEWEFLERNVLKGVKLLNVDNQLHDVADQEQLARLVDILRTDSNRPVCNIIMFLLSTGARKMEVLTATWGQIDMDRGLWTIPAATAKSKKSRTVPLNDSAMWVLVEMAKSKSSDAIFANPATGKPFTEITRVWYRLRKAAGIQQMRLHACRHQFAEMVVSSGRSLYDVQVLLGHSDPRVSQRYAKLSMSTLREAAGTASLFVTSADSTPSTPVPSGTSGVVVPFQRAA